MLEWMGSHANAIWMLTAASVVTFLAGLVLVPLVAVRIPADYFARATRGSTVWGRRPGIRWLFLAAKNALGVVFLVAGVLMLVLPGPGVFTILVALMLVDFPGKFRFQKWLVGRRPILGTVNWLRERAGRPPLILEDGER